MTTTTIRYYPRRLRLAALNIDGVLLPDSFSPVIHRFVTRRGGTYTAELEHAVFSQNRAKAAQALADALDSDLSTTEIVAEYFKERDAYLAENPLQPMPGALDLVRRLRAHGLRTVVYGGLGIDHFERYFAKHRTLFDDPRYVCTNGMRPGLSEITELFGLTPGNILFIDDVARVAEAAKRLNAPFIGHPSAEPHNHQAAAMRELGVKHIVRSLTEIDDVLISALDHESATDTLWARTAVTAPGTMRW